MELGNTSPTQETLSELSTGQTFILSAGVTQQSTHCALQAEGFRTLVFGLPPLLAPLLAISLHQSPVYSGPFICRHLLH